MWFLCFLPGHKLQGPLCPVLCRPLASTHPWSTNKAGGPQVCVGAEDPGNVRPPGTYSFTLMERLCGFVGYSWNRLTQACRALDEHLSGGDKEVSWWPSGKKKQTGRRSTISPSTESLGLAVSSSDLRLPGRSEVLGSRPHSSSRHQALLRESRTWCQELLGETRRSIQPCCLGHKMGKEGGWGSAEAQLADDGLWGEIVPPPRV